VLPRITREYSFFLVKIQYLCILSESDPNPYHCTSCEIKLESLHIYMAHRKTHARERRNPLAKKANPSKDVLVQKFTCSFCGYITTSDELLNQHTAEHRGQSPDHSFRRVLCTENPHLRNSVDVRRHVIYTHNEPRVKRSLNQ